MFVFLFFSVYNYYYWFALSLQGKVHERGKGHLEVKATERLSHLVVLEHLSYTNSSARSGCSGTGRRQERCTPPPSLRDWWELRV